MYGVMETLKVPLRLIRLQAWEMEVTETIDIDGKKYKFDTKVSNEASKTIFFIEDSLSLQFVHNERC